MKKYIFPTTVFVIASLLIILGILKIRYPLRDER
jgi:hypothetical protein